MNAAITLKNKRNSRYGPALTWAFSKEMDDPKVAQILYFASRRGNNFNLLELNDILLRYKHYMKVCYGTWRAVVDRLPVVSVKPSQFKNSRSNVSIMSGGKKRIRHSRYGFYDNDRIYVPRKNEPPKLTVGEFNEAQDRKRKAEYQLGPEDNDDDI